MHNDELVGTVKKRSKRLKRLIYYMFEMSSAHLNTDTDGRKRMYFSELASDEGEETHQRLLAWLYYEFRRQIFGRRTEMSCIMFIERISCKFNKNKDPNKIDDFKHTTVPKKDSDDTGKRNSVHETIAKLQKGEDGDASDLPDWSGLKLPKVGLTVNDWFDPVFLQTRIELLMRNNEVESVASAAGSDAMSNRE